MGIINRFLLFIYAGVALLVALFIIAFAFKAFPEHVVFNEIGFLLHQPETLKVAGVFALFSVYFLLYAFFVGEKKKAEAPVVDDVVIKTETGEVHIARTAIESLVDREATSIGGVRESISKVTASYGEGKEGGTKLSLKLSLVLLANANVPKVSDEVTKAVKSRIFDSLGIQDAPVAVSVSELNNAPAENQKRVH